eukprot:scaffold5.g822.t1
MAWLAVSQALSSHHAVIVSSSRYWFNYRHATNTLGVYQAIRRLGIPDSNIVLMLAETEACDPRNSAPGRVASGAGRGANLYSPDIEVDYSGKEVSVDSFLRVLTGRHLPGTPAGKRLLSGRNSSVLLFLTGHGGDEFLKFHDHEELLAADIGSAVGQMWAGGRYGQLLMASTLANHITSPNVISIASSKLGQSSYAHHSDATLGLHITDQFSFHLETFLLEQAAAAAAGAAPAAGPSGAGAARGAGAAPGASLQDMLDAIRRQTLSSTVVARADAFPRPLAEVGVAEFFGGGALLGWERAGAAATATGRWDSTAVGGSPEEAGAGLAGQREQASAARSGQRECGQLGEGEEEEEEEQAPEELRRTLVAAGRWATPPARRPGWQWRVIHAADWLGLVPSELAMFAAVGLPLLALHRRQRRQGRERQQSVEAAGG